MFATQIDCVAPANCSFYSRQIRTLAFVSIVFNSPFVRHWICCAKTRTFLDCISGGNTPSTIDLWNIEFPDVNAHLYRNFLTVDTFVCLQTLCLTNGELFNFIHSFGFHSAQRRSPLNFITSFGWIFLSVFFPCFSSVRRCWWLLSPCSLRPPLMVAAFHNKK